MLRRQVLYANSRTLSGSNLLTSWCSQVVLTILLNWIWPITPGRVCPRSLVTKTVCVFYYSFLKAFHREVMLTFKSWTARYLTRSGSSDKTQKRHVFHISISVVKRYLHHLVFPSKLVENVERREIPHLSTRILLEQEMLTRRVSAVLYNCRILCHNKQIVCILSPFQFPFVCAWNFLFTPPSPGPLLKEVVLTLNL